MKVYKYPIFDIRELLVDKGTFCYVDMPKDSIGLASILQGTTLVIYAAVDPHAPIIDRHTFFVIGTGYELPDEICTDKFSFTGSYYHAEFGLVAHLFHKLTRTYNT